jgi:hypothetical protein
LSTADRGYDSAELGLSVADIDALRAEGVV